MSINPLTAGSTNAASGILGSLGDNSSLISSIQTQLSTNKKTLDPAQQGVVTRLTSQVKSFEAAASNISKAKNVLNVAATGLTSIASLLTQMQALANQANDATMGDSDKLKLQQTFTALLTQVNATANGAKVDGVGLIGAGGTGGVTNLNIQTGLTSADTTEIQAQSSDATGLSITGLSITGSGAGAAMTALASALSTISGAQSSIAANQLTLDTVAAQDASISTNVQNAIDSIQKPDAAALQMQLQNANNQQSMNYYLINQMNQEAQAVLTIFR